MIRRSSSAGATQCSCAAELRCIGRRRSGATRHVGESVVNRAVNRLDVRRFTLKGWKLLDHTVWLDDRIAPSKRVDIY